MFGSLSQISFFLVLLLFGAGCKSAYDAAYYRTMEAFGKEKRDLLVDRVEEARDSQKEAQEQFKSALEAFSEVVGFEGGELEALYDRLNTQYERSQMRAEEVRDEIKEVEDVGEALFKEWEEELEEYSDPDLRRASEEQRRATRRRFDALVTVMRRAEAKMPPVLEAFQDQVLYLKHNLNARAVAALEGKAATLEGDIARLIEEMEASIEEANRFIDEMQG